MTSPVKSAPTLSFQSLTASSSLGNEQLSAKKPIEQEKVQQVADKGKVSLVNIFSDEKWPPVALVEKTVAFDVKQWRSIKLSQVLEKKLTTHALIFNRLLLPDNILLTIGFQGAYENQQNKKILIEYWDLAHGVVTHSHQLECLDIVLKETGDVIFVNEHHLILLDPASVSHRKSIQVEGTITKFLQLKSGLCTLVINHKVVQFWDILTATKIKEIDLFDAKADANFKSDYESVSASYRASNEAQMQEYNRYWKEVYYNESERRDYEAKQHLASERLGQTRSYYDNRLQAIKNQISGLLITEIQEQQEGRLAVRLGSGKIVVVSPEGVIESDAKAIEFSASSGFYMNAAPIVLPNGSLVEFNRGSSYGKLEGCIMIWKSLDKKIESFLRLNRDQILLLPKEMTFEEIDELLTLCEKQPLIKGIRLEEGYRSSGLLRTRAYYLCPQPMISPKERTNLKISADFICSITGEIMLDPVIAADGETYERFALKSWLDVHDTSPKYNVPLEHKQLIPNRNLQRRIKELLDQHPFLFEEPNGNDDSVYVAGVLKEMKILMDQKEALKLQQLVEQYPHIVQHSLEGATTLLHLACRGPSPEVLKAVVKGLGKQIVPILKKYKVEQFFQLAAHSMGARGAAWIAKATFMDEQELFQQAKDALASNDLAILKTCIDLGLSVNATEAETGNSLLHIAVKHNQRQLAEFLIDTSADIYLKNCAFQTAEELAYSLNSQEMVKAIRETHLRKISAPGMHQRMMGLEIQNQELAILVASLQQQVSELNKAKK